jgi:DNA invertase Pin-like site-specific DNA recombinase
VSKVVSNDKTFLQQQIFFFFSHNKTIQNYFPKICLHKGRAFCTQKSSLKYRLFLSIKVLFEIKHMLIKTWTLFFTRRVYMSNKKMAYARVSSTDQNLDRQLIELKKYVPESNIVVDKISGKTLHRPGYEALKGALGLRSGDTLVIKSLDRLSRNKADIKKELEWFKSNHIRLMILDLPTTMVQVPDNQEWILDMLNNILIEVLSSMAEQERLLIHSRQKEGIAAAKLQGKHLGRPKMQFPNDWEHYYTLWKNHDITAKKAMQSMNLSSSSFYKLAKQFQNTV